MAHEVIYSTDFNDFAEQKEIAAGCVHLICLQGAGYFMMEHRPVTFSAGQLVVVPRLDVIGQCHAGSDVQVAMVVADAYFILSLLPQNHFGVSGSIDLYHDPIIPLRPDDQQRLLEDMQRIGERLSLEGHQYYNEMIGSLLLAMVYDIFDVHSRREFSETQSHQGVSLLREFRQLLESGLPEREREVAYYANLLHVTPKYLGDTVRRASGMSAVSLIDMHTIPILVEHLRNPKLSFTQIADLMNFNTLSYFGRYVKKHLGVSPSQFRESGIKKN